MPERTFCRRFFAQVGTSPARWLIGQRVIAAQRLLETTALAVEDIADRIGMTAPPTCATTSALACKRPRPTTGGHSGEPRVVCTADQPERRE